MRSTWSRLSLSFCPFCSIIVYKSSQRSKKVRLQHFFAPDKSTITCLVYKKGCLYVGLVSGSVAVYSRSQGVCHTRKREALVNLCVLLDSCITNVYLLAGEIAGSMSLNYCHYRVQQRCVHGGLLDSVWKACRLTVLTQIISLNAFWNL